jgi:hypothetical protein
MSPSPLGSVGRLVIPLKQYEDEDFSKIRLRRAGLTPRDG